MSFAEIEISSGDVSAKVVPQRGALVSSLVVRGTEMLFLLRDTLQDEKRMIRGGIPIMFPFCSSLEGGIFIPSGKPIPQHGFVRDAEWRVVAERPGSMRLRLDSDEETFAVFPWQFRLEHSVILTNDGLHLELQIQNHGAKPMPVAPGWHPYFALPADEIGLVDGDLPELNPGRFTNPKGFDFGLVPPMNARVAFGIPTLGRVSLSFSPEMRHLQFWTMPGRDFICIEPFTGPPNHINTPLAPIIPPGAARTFWFRIELLNERAD